MNQRFKILIVDDETDMREALLDLFRREKYEVTSAASGEEALEMLSRYDPDLIITDIIMPGIHGIELLKRVKAHNSETFVLMITGLSSIPGAVQAMRYGAEDYITKPFENVEILRIVKRLAENKLLKEQSEMYRQETLRKSAPDIVGQSEAIRKLLSHLTDVAQSDAAVLITGESGTGKELIARAIHDISTRKEEPYVVINTSAVPADLLESEFYGHERGAFSGAVDRKYGLFEVADGGTLFLDEIGDMPLPLQPKILRTVETKTFRRLGGTTEIRSDFRIVSATNRNLKQKIEAREFREDLFFRLATFAIEVPPLREHRDDIPLIALHYLKKRGYNGSLLTDDVSDALASYDWPGNVRELENVLERAVVLSQRRTLQLKSLPLEIQESYWKGSGEMKVSTDISSLDLAEIEKHHILKVYEQCRHDKVKAAKLLGVGLKTLYRKLKRYGVNG